MNWIKTEDEKPEYDKAVLVWCRVYGRFLATYVCVGNFRGESYGNWRDFNGNLGILPPIYWMPLPEPPEHKESIL